MKGKVIGLSLLMTMILSGCVVDSITSVSEDNSSVVEETKESSQGIQEEKVEYPDCYKLVKETTDRKNPESNHFVFVGPKGVVEIDGYRWIDDFYNGKAIAIDANNKDTVIDIEGKPLISPGIYDDIRMMDIRSDYYAVRDAATQKYGVIDYMGNCIVPCEYDNVSSQNNGKRYIFPVKKDGLYSVYTNAGLLVQSNVAEEKPAYALYDEGIIRVWADEEICYYSEKTGELLFRESPDLQIDNSKLDGVSGILTYREAYIGKTKWLNEECTDFLEVDLPAEMRLYDALEDRVLFSDKNHDVHVYSRSGKFLHTFFDYVTVSQSVNGSFRYIEEVGKDGECKIYDENFQQVGFITNTCTPQPAEGYMLAVEFEEDSTMPDITNIYDCNGKLLYRNVKRVDSQVFLFQLENGLYVYKKEGSSELIELELDPTEKYYMQEDGRLWFKDADNGWIIRDADMKELFRYDSAGRYDYQFSMVIWNGKYYNYDGILLYEEEE